MNKTLSIFLVCFAAASFLMLYQHYFSDSWDFEAYAMNGKWFCGEGKYFEWQRPPGVPFFLCLFGSVFGWEIASTVFVLFVVALFGYSIYLLAQRLGIEPNYAIFLSMASYAFINYGTSAGTEALSIAFLMLSLATYPKARSGVFFSLAFLCRYNLVIFLPLFLLLEHKHKIRPVIAALLTLLPWLLYSFVNKGDPLFGIYDAFYLNVMWRQAQQIIQAPSIQHFIGVFGLLSIFFLFAFFNKDFKKNRNLLLLWLALGFVEYMYTPAKDPRYLFPVLPALAFMSFYGMKFLSRGVDKELLKVAFVVLNLMLAIGYLEIHKANYFDVVERNRDCYVMSNNWVPLDYNGLMSLPAPIDEGFEKYFDQDYRFIFFKYGQDPPYLISPEFKEKIREYIIYEDARHFVFQKGAECRPAPRSVEFSSAEFHKSMGV